MNIIYRIVLTFYTIVIAMLSLVVALCSLNFLPAKYLVGLILTIPENTYYCVGGVLLLALSVWLLTKSMSGPQGALQLVDSPDGRVALSQRAIENYASALAKEIYGVFNVKSIGELNDGGINVRINASIEPGISIPAASQEVKVNVREGLKNATGVEVQNVEIFFKQIKPQE